MKRIAAAVFFATLVSTSAFAQARVFPAISAGLENNDRVLRVTARVINSGNELAHDVVLSVQFPPALRLLHAVPAYGWAFRWDDGTYVAEMRSIGLDPGADDMLTLFFRIDAEFYGELSLSATASARGLPPVTNRIHPLTINRLFRITSNADSGPGSFRDTIELVNGFCDGTVPCAVTTVAGLSPVVLESPLPPITASDTTIAGPLEIDGSRLAQGNGIELRGGGTTAPLIVGGIIARGFPGNGFEIAGGDRFANYILQFCQAVGNRNRGISINDPRASMRIEQSEIRSNGRSGVVVNAVGSLALASNVISGNGASGIFVTAPASYISGHGNTIENHPDFGIAVVPGVWMSIQSTQSTGNRALDVDFGLDGPTPNDADERDRLVNTPELTDAYYDADRRRTIVKGVLRTSAVLGENFHVHVYAGRNVNAFGIADKLGTAGSRTVAVGRLGGTFSVEFELEVEADLRGYLLSAQTQLYEYEGWTSGRTTLSEVAGALAVR